MSQLAGGPALFGAAAHVFVVELAPRGADLLDVDERDFHHLANVMRLREGEIVTVSDGMGSWRRCIYRAHFSAEHDHANHFRALEPAGPVIFSAAAQPPITVGFSLLKGDRTEWVVQKLTELGVDRIIPLITQRTVVRWDEAKIERQMQRLGLVAREAAMQSRRVRIPALHEPVRASAVAEMMFHSCGDAAMLERGGGPLSLATPFVLVGPEGGWTPEEAELGMPLVAAGDAVLRSETAAVSAASILCGLRAGNIALPEPLSG